MKDNKIIINAYTDAASYNNGRKIAEQPQHSCSAAILVYDDQIIYSTNYFNEDTTSSYGEMFAIYMILMDFKNLYKKGLRSGKDTKVELRVHSDSAYCVTTFNTNLKQWKRRSVGGVLYNTTGPIAYQDMILSIDELMKDNEYKVKLLHIKGHVSSQKDFVKARQSWERFNGSYISDERLNTHVYFNNIVDKYAVSSLKAKMGGESSNDRTRKRFKKRVDSIFK